MFVSLLLLAAPAAVGQYPADPWQWQPEFTDKGFDSDRRLERTVSIEIVGRPAAAVLQLLSQEIGVDLSVSGENLDTVGERKLTIIAKGCSLKGIMVQIPEALQECHWRISRGGPQPVYQLHRNAGVDYAKLKAALMAGVGEQRSGAAWRARVGRVEEAAGALGLPRSDLEALSKKDPFLALTMNDRYARARLEAFLALPADIRARFDASGEASMSTAEAPAGLRQTARESVEAWLTTGLDYMIKHPERLPEPLTPEAEASARQMNAEITEELPRATLTFRDLGVESGRGILLVVKTPAHGEQELVVVPPRYPDPGSSSPVIPLMIAAGAGSVEGAQHALQEWQREGLEARSRVPGGEKATGASGSAACEPAVLFNIAEEGPLQLTDLQRSIAGRTGLSIVSDYSTRDYVMVPSEARAERPLWQVLDLLAQSSPAGFRWRMRGQCLVFHRSMWAVWALREIPESIIVRYREKLVAQGHLSLDDVAAFYVELADRPLLREKTLELPDDLREAGVFCEPWAPLLYASLSPEQRRRARSPGGLQMSELATRLGGATGLAAALEHAGLAAAQVAEANYRITEQSGQESGKRVSQYDFRLELPDQHEQIRTTTIHLWEVPVAPSVLHAAK
jgi:hypothetical protein